MQRIPGVIFSTFKAEMCKHKSNFMINSKCLVHKRHLLEGAPSLFTACERGAHLHINALMSPC